MVERTVFGLKIDVYKRQLRAYDHYKHKIGSKECEDGKIFIEPQGFCVIAEIGKDEGLCLKAMQSVEKYLDTCLLYTSRCV